MDNKKVIDNWITRQEGFFITGSHLECPICKKDVANKVITKTTGFCMSCFINQIVMACEKEDFKKFEFDIQILKNSFDKSRVYSKEDIEAEIDQIFSNITVEKMKQKK